jgi:hypothetical protein
VLERRKRDKEPFFQDPQQDRNRPRDSPPAEEARGRIAPALFRRKEPPDRQLLAEELAAEPRRH